MITRMRLTDHLDAGLINLDLQSRNKRDAIEEVASLLRDSKQVKDWPAFVDAVLAREAIGSTAIGKGVALPHARTDTVAGFALAIGRSENGIDFDAVDGQPVHLVFLMGIPVIEVRSYLKLLAHMNRLFKLNGFIDDLNAASDSEVLIELFRRHEA